MSYKFTRELDTILAAHGFTLVRNSRHLCYGNSDGRTVTFASTPSDWRAACNQVRDLRRAFCEKQPDTTIDAVLPKNEAS